MLTCSRYTCTNWSRHLCRSKVTCRQGIFYSVDSISWAIYLHIVYAHRTHIFVQEHTRFNIMVVACSEKPALWPSGNRLTDQYLSAYFHLSRGAPTRAPNTEHVAPEAAHIAPEAAHNINEKLGRCCAVNTYGGVCITLSNVCVRASSSFSSDSVAAVPSVISSLRESPRSRGGGGTWYPEGPRGPSTLSSLIHLAVAASALF